MLVQGAFNMLFRPGLRRDFRDSFDGFDPEYSQFLNTTSTTDPEQQASIITGMSRMVERGDGEGIVYEDPKMGPKVIGVDKEFALGFMISRRTVEDDQYKKANQAAKWLGHAARMTQEYRSAALLDDAFAGVSFRGIDTLPLIHANHTLINSSKTVSNRIAGDTALSVAGVTAGMDLYQQLKDENGDPMRASADQLVISNNANDMNVALQIFNSQLEPFTANNQENALRIRLPKPKISTSHYKTSLKSWFMVSSKLNDAWFVTRRAVEFDDTFDFDTDVAKYKASQRFLVWFVDWRGWVGSNTP